MSLGRSGWTAISLATAMVTWAVVEALERPWLGAGHPSAGLAGILAGGSVLRITNRVGLLSAPYSQSMLGLRDQVDPPPGGPRSTPSIDAHPEVVTDFLRRVMLLDAAPRVLSDDTMLWNLHGEESNSEFVQRTMFVYGVDISDIQPPYLCEIAERIARRRVAPADTRLTYDDLKRLADDRKRREIVDGELYVTPPPNMRHQDLVGRLYLAIASSLAANKEAGRVFLSPFDVVFSPHDVVEPDLVFVADDQLDILTARNVQGSPALVVDVLAPGTRRTAEQIKPPLFARTGVRGSWLVDPELDLITVSRRSADGAFRRVAELAAENGDTLTTPLLPEFALPVSNYFAPSI